jgi:Flp pilus assembly pilin Flp
MSTRRLTLGDRGSVTVEYTVLLVLVALGTALATKAIGPSLVRAFLAQQTWLLLGL